MKSAEKPAKALQITGFSHPYSPQLAVSLFLLAYMSCALQQAVDQNVILNMFAKIRFLVGCFLWSQEVQPSKPQFTTFES